MNFSYEQTTKIVFGRGKIDSIGEIASQYGKNVLLVTESVNSPLAPLYERVKGLLQQAGLTVHHYDGVVPNPTTESVDAGTQMARSEKVDAVIGIGGGLSLIHIFRRSGMRKLAESFKYFMAAPACWENRSSCIWGLAFLQSFRSRAPA